MAYAQLPLEQVSRVPGFNGAEGVAVDREGRVYGGGADGVVRRRGDDGRVEEFARCSDGQLGGLAFDREDNLFVCDGFTGVLLRVDRSGNVTSFAEWAGDVRLHVPNFPVFDAAGDLWVSNSFDRPLSEVDFAAQHASPEPLGSLVRFRPDGSGDVVATGLYLANGLAIDPGEEHVYVLQSTRQNLVRLPLAGGEPELYCADLLGGPDGMAFDEEGYAIVTQPGAHRLVVVDLDGRASVLVDDPAGATLVFPTNCAFGGPGFDDLYVAQMNTDDFALVHLGRRGHPLVNRRS
jgi:sugar lactone lactonase YvrE